MPWPLILLSYCLFVYLFQSFTYLVKGSYSYNTFLCLIILTPNYYQLQGYFDGNKFTDDFIKIFRKAWVSLGVILLKQNTMY